MRRFRLYIDESGDHTYRSKPDFGSRYLGLTGVLIEAEYYRTTLQPGLERLKQDHFPHNPDEPVVLVRKDIVNKRNKFFRLRFAEANARWQMDFIDFCIQMQAALFTVVIDKHCHRERYGKFAEHPYHYCLEVMLERLRGHLKAVNGQADVMAEARGGVEDKLLAKAYTRLYQHGTRFISGDEFRKVLTSKELKLKAKDRNIAGLQIADLLAHPTKIGVLKQRGVEIPLGEEGVFGRKLDTVVRKKFNQYGRYLLN